jgi:hypothetical protein
MTSSEKWGGPIAPLSKSIAYPATETGDTGPDRSGFGLADDSQPRIFRRVSEMARDTVDRLAPPQPR